MKTLKQAYDYTSISVFPFCPHSLHEPSYTFQAFFPISSKANANTQAVTPDPHDEIIIFSKLKLYLFKISIILSLSIIYPWSFIKTLKGILIELGI